MNNNIQTLIKYSDWNTLLQTFNIEQIASSLSFKEGIILSYKMLYNDAWDENVQNYAVNLLYTLRDKYPNEWNASWTFDSFLGNACNITLRYDERYEAYKRASEKISPIPPSLMVLLARCYICPGEPPISQEETENLLRKALKIEQTIEGVSLMKRISESKNNFEEAAYWDKILKEVTAKNIHIHDIQPDFLKNISTNN
jgi:cytochrome c-type biogenesis protein CcmH/NrfG